MTALHPTPTRLALLAAVRDGRVRRSAVYVEDFADDVLSGRTATVTDRMRTLQAAGWVVLGGDRGQARRHWQLTTAGAEILAAGTTGGAS